MSYLPTIAKANEYIVRNVTKPPNKEKEIIRDAIDPIMERIKKASPYDSWIGYTLYESNQPDKDVDLSMLDRCGAQLTEALNELGFHVKYDPHMEYICIGGGKPGWSKKIIIENMFAPERADWGYKVKRSDGNPFPVNFDIFSVQGHGDERLSEAKKLLRLSVKYAFVSATKKRVSVPLEDGWMRIAAIEEQKATQKARTPYSVFIENNQYILTWN